MTSLTGERVAEETNVETLIIKLQENMKLYDKLVAQIAEGETAQLQAEEILGDFDLDQAVLENDTAAAFAALNKIVIDRKLAELGRSKEGVEFLSSMKAESLAWSRSEFSSEIQQLQA